jgi:predicted nucleic acid-binding protein
MLPSVYIETTIPSYLTSWPSRDIVRAAHQRLTKDWWMLRRGLFRLYTSELVRGEASLGDPTAASERLDSLTDVEILPINDSVGPLASEIARQAGIPEKAKTDAAHVAIAAIYGMDFLLTWNCTHINNAQLLSIIEKTCADNGVTCPVVCTPEELMGL